MKRFLSILLTGALTLGLAGCAKEKPAADTPAIGTSVPMGRWVEQAVPITPGTPFGTITQQQDGSLLLFSREESALHALRSGDSGVTWSEEPALLAGLEQKPYLAIAAPDGTLLVETAAGEEEQDWILHADGRAEPLDLGGLTEEVPTPNFCHFLDEDTLLIALRGESYVYGGSVGLLRYQLSTGTANALPEIGADATDLRTGTAVGGWLYYINWEGGQLCALDAEGNQKTVLDSVPGADSYNAALASDTEGALYFAVRDGIYRLAPGGTLPERIVDGLGTAMGVDSNYIDSLCRTADGSFLVLMSSSSGGGSTLYRYYFDETLPAAGQTTLEVWCLTDENSTVRAAINAYRQACPEVEIKLTVGVPDPDGDNFSAARRDALTNLNTQLLAGEGPDLLILDGTDYETYLAKGLLADLSDVLDTGALLPNIAGPFVQADGAIYLMPARFRVPVLYGDAGATAGMTDLAAMQAEVLACAPRPDVDCYSENYYVPLPNAEKYALGITTAEDLADFVLPTSAAAILHDNEVEETALREALTFVQTVARHYGMENYHEEQAINGVSMSGGDGDVVTIMNSGIEYSQSQRAKYGWETMDTPWMASMIAQDDLPCEIALRPGLCEGAYQPAVLTAVNANTGHPEEAKALAAAFFDAAVQDVYCQDGMAVRAESLREKKLNLIAQEKLACQTDLETLLAGCKTPVTVNRELRDSFLAHTTALVEGSEDLEAAMAGIQKDMSLYLAERQ